MLSEQMLIDRAGNFTASENHRLMAEWDKPKPSRDYEEFHELYNCLKHFEKKPLVGEIKESVECKVTGDLLNKTWAVIKSEVPPVGLVTYAEEKAIEEFFDPDPSLRFKTVHTQNGEEREVDCMGKLSDALKDVEFINIGEQQAHIHADGIGCTPDGIVLDDLDLVLTGAEVKCKSPLVHAKNLLINNNQDLKESAFDHFVQIQTAMLVTGAEYWYFANYNPYAKTEEMKFKYVIINRDDDFISVLKERISIAKNIKKDFSQKLRLLCNKT